MSKPGDFIAFGILLLVLGGIAYGVLLGAGAPLPLLLAVAIPVGTVGGTVFNVGVIGWGVRIGMRAAQEDIRGR